MDRETSASEAAVGMAWAMHSGGAYIPPPCVSVASPALASLLPACCSCSCTVAARQWWHTLVDHPGSEQRNPALHTRTAATACRDTQGSKGGDRRAERRIVQHGCQRAPECDRLPHCALLHYTHSTALFWSCAALHRAVHLCGITHSGVICTLSVPSAERPLCLHLRVRAFLCLALAAGAYRWPLRRHSHVVPIPYGRQRLQIRGQ